MRTERRQSAWVSLLMAAVIGAPVAGARVAAADDDPPAAGETHRQYFAEGASGYFETHFGLVNPHETESAAVSLVLLTELGEAFTAELAIGPRQRTTVSADAILGGAPRAFSAVVTSDQPIAADRFMRWGGPAFGSSLERGAASPSTTWYFAEGASGPFATFYLLFNPGAEPAQVTIAYFRESGGPVHRTYTVPPETRRTIWVDGDPDLASALAGAVLTADVPVVAERVMYLDAGGEVFRAGAAAAGAADLAVEWHFAEGMVGPFFDEFLLLVNPWPEAVDAEVAFHVADHDPIARTYRVPPEARRTIWLNHEAASHPELAPLVHQPVSLIVRSDAPIVAERSMWGPPGGWYENHTSGGATEPAAAWTIPSGAVGGSADEQTYVLVFNPSDSTGGLRVTLLPDEGPPQTRQMPIGRFGRTTLDIGTTFDLEAAAFSLLVESVGDPGVPLVVEYVRYASRPGRPLASGAGALAVPRAPPVTPPDDERPEVTATSPADGAGDVPPANQLLVSFSMPVTATPAAFALECPAGSPIALTVATALPAAEIVLEPAAFLPPESSCVFTVRAGEVADAADPANTLAADHVVSFSTSACPPIVISPETLAAGTVGAAYGPVSFSTTGSSGAVVWSLAGVLPSGLFFDVDGVLAGTPTVEGEFSFTVVATDADSCRAERIITLAIDCPEIEVTTAGPVPGGVVGTPYAGVAFQQTGGAVPVTWSVTGGVLPAGVSLDPATGVLSGTPAESGTFVVTVTATDANGCVGSLAITIEVDCPVIVVDATPLPDGEVGTPYGAVRSATGGTAPYTYAVTDGVLPDGLTLDAAGTLSGIPTGAGDFGFTVTATDAYGCAGSAQYSLTIHPETNLPPTLTNDPILYATAGNTQLHVSGASLAGVAFAADGDGLLVKAAPVDPDLSGPLAVLPDTGTSTNGGAFSVGADGSFTYVPPPSFQGTDSFTYQVTDNHPSIPELVTGTVEIEVSELVWYVRDAVDGDNPVGGDGRSTDAFETLAAAEAAAGPGHTIFVFRGHTDVEPLGGGITLDDGQKLIGEGVGLALPGVGTLVPAGLQPRITNAALGGHGVTVTASGVDGDRTAVEIRGLEISGAGDAVHVTSSDAAALDVRVGENTIGGAGLSGIAVTAGSSSDQALALHDNVVTADGPGINLLGADGTLTVTAFANNTVTGGTGGAGILVAGIGVVFDADPSTAGFQTVAGGAVVAGAPADPVSGTALQLEGVSGDLAFDSINLFCSGGPCLSVGGTGGYTGAAGLRVRHLAPGTGVVLTGAGTVVDLDSLTADLRFDVIASVGSPALGVRLTSLVDGSGTVAQFGAGPASAIAGAVGAAFLIDGGHPTVLYEGSITNAAGRSVMALNRTGGSATFSGGIDDTGAGILLSANAAAAVTTFSGGLALATGAEPALMASGGGTLHVCDANPCNPAEEGPFVNSVATTTGTAVSIVNTTIGPSGVTLRSVRADGAPNGIVLSNTGAAGTFTVTGTGASTGAGARGTIAASLGSGGTIEHTTDHAIVLANVGGGVRLRSLIIGDAAATADEAKDQVNHVAGHGIAISGSSDIALENVKIARTGGHGISGIGVANFSLVNAEVLNAGDQNDEDGLHFAAGDINLEGAALVRDSILAASAENNLLISNASGVLELTVENTHLTRTANTAAMVNGEEGIVLETRTGGADPAIMATVTGSQFDLIESDGIWVGANAGTITLIATGNSFAGFDAGTSFSDNAISLNSAGDGSAVAARIEGNQFTDSYHSTIILNFNSTGDGDPAFSTEADVVIAGNTFQGTTLGRQIDGLIDDNSTVRLLIDGNAMDGHFLGAVNLAVNNIATLHGTILGNSLGDAQGSGGFEENLSLTINDAGASAFLAIEGNDGVGASPIGPFGQAEAIGVLNFGGSADVELERGSSASNDPATVLLENNPNPAPGASNGTGVEVFGTVAVVASGTVELPVVP